MAASPPLPFDRTSLSWRVSAEPVAFLGGGRALLLQVAHPKVAAGVEQHSTYATDPWARLFRTVDVMVKLAFGAPEVSAAQARLLEDMHRRVVGTTSEGEPYHALDPDLLLWVWATLCDTALRMYELVFPPLTADDRERYYDEWKVVAHACGVPDGGCPNRWVDFEAYVAGVVRRDLQVTPAARKVAHATMVPPLPWPLRPVAAWPHQLLTVGLFPPHLRAQFGFGWDERRARQLRLLLAGLRVPLRLTPRPVRDLPVRWIVRRDKTLRFAPLQRHGAKLTAKRMAQLPTKPATDVH